VRRLAPSIVVACALLLGAAAASGADAASRDAGLGAAGAAARAHHKVVFATQELWHAHAQRSVASAGAPAGSGLLQFGGGAEGVGVISGAPSVYVVLWGTQWGTQAVDANGIEHFSGDTSGVVPRLEGFLKGLGTDGERWSAIATQYCEGVAAGATSCPSNVPHVVAPSGGVLRGVWADESAASPAQSTDDQLASEAATAALHFGNVTPTANRLAQYVVVSPSGSHPGGFETPMGDFCGWHASTSSQYGEIAFTNLPYVTDAGASCGANYVHAGAAGLLDGVTIVEGHELEETVTDEVPPAGWTDAAGYEIADKCAWIGVGGTGGAQDIALATGSFPVAGLWSNADGECVIGGDVVVGTSPDVITVVGDPATASLTGRMLGTAASDVPADPADPLSVRGDSFCSTVTFGPGGIAPPATAADGLAALAGALAGTYPDPTTDAGHGCVDVVRSTIGPGG
jgi:hypothetical protein